MAQSIVTTNFGANPPAPAEEASASKGLLDYVLPYIPGLGRKWRAPEEEPQMAPPPVQRNYSAKPPEKRRVARKRKARPAAVQPAAAPAPQKSKQAVAALSACLSRYSARSKDKGLSPDALMAQAADGACKKPFERMAEAITREEGENAREKLALIIREELAPAVEAGLAKAR